MLCGDPCCCCAPSQPTLCDPMDCSPPSSSALGIFEARKLELPLPPPGDLPDPGIEPKSLKSPSLASGFFTTSITWETVKGTLWLHNRRQSFSFLNQSPFSVPTSYSRNEKELEFRVMYQTGVEFWNHWTGVPLSHVCHMASHL